MLKLGYKASSEQFGPRELAEYAVLAEELGFDSVVVADHFQPWRHDGGHAPFSFAWMAAVGERTKRVELGTSVVAPSYRYHPGIVAQAIATLAVLYPGRVFLGVGTGEAMNETPLGVEWPDQKERFQRLKEACLLMQRLWTEERVTFEGNYFRTENATIYDRPEGGVPLYIAAAGPAAARLAGRIADGFITTSGKSPELYAEKLIPAVREGVEKEGRSIDDVELTIEMKVSFDTDNARAMEDTRNWGALALTPEEKVGVDDPIEMQRLADALPAERAASRWIVSDDPQAQVEAIQPYLDLGFSHLTFHFPGEDQERALRLYAEHVLPLLRDRAG
ncbi:MAG TPA: glucose-6-phosphate dehydrogenase (coenzyme-F420) [Thermoleophilaceae bacterium]|nr:glucose-6-phosphate dehydrogenase (coenzyme-F420) [Thermoleophilaceae bacterium]